MRPVIAFILLWLTGTALVAQTARRGQKAHPEIDAGVECATCHEAESSAWNDSRHGIALVKCVACHGYPGQNLAARPAAATCRSCHPAQFETAAASCQNCHPAHAFRLHRTTAGGSK
jgi:hypothetical protein